MVVAQTKVSISKPVHRRLARIAGRGKELKQVKIVDRAVSRELDELERQAATPEQVQKRSAPQAEMSAREGAADTTGTTLAGADAGLSKSVNEKTSPSVEK